MTVIPISKPSQYHADELLTIREVRLVLKCSDTHIRNLINSGRLPSTLRDGLRRVRYQDLRDYWEGAA